MTWMLLPSNAMRANHDPGPVVAYAPDEEAFGVEFDHTSATIEGPPVLAWTDLWVYFPLSNDGGEWLGSVSRNPTAVGQPHLVV